MRAYSLEIFADYFQFYLFDEKSNPNFEEEWSPFAVNNLMAVTKEGIGIETVRNMVVPVHLILHDAEPRLREDVRSVFQINEAEISIRSGKLVVMGCSDYLPEAKRIELPNGRYKIRVYYHGLDTVSEDGLDGDDSYGIEIWKTNKEQAPTFQKIKPLPKR
ncbi:hypothetical protein [Maribacter sp. 2307ULW6-5]|uniref:hypothetical protein n=1 Tax=Maribacter sp. 2307ULW6-5 TaxID=3386275 RepID=UPI0039BD8DF5